MASISPERAKMRARIAATKRHHPDRPDLIANDQRTLKMARAEDFIRGLVESFPPLTDDQRSRLATLLQPAPAAQDGGEDAA